MGRGHKHHVRIRLRYVNGGQTPWKWQGECLCGWACQSWAWARDADNSGALHMSLDHLSATGGPR